MFDQLSIAHLLLLVAAGAAEESVMANFTDPDRLSLTVNDEMIERAVPKFAAVRQHAKSAGRCGMF